MGPIDPTIYEAEIELLKNRLGLYKEVVQAADALAELTYRTTPTPSTEVFDVLAEGRKRKEAYKSIRAKLED